MTGLAAVIGIGSNVESAFAWPKKADMFCICSLVGDESTGKNRLGRSQHCQTALFHRFIKQIQFDAECDEIFVDEKIQRPHRDDLSSDRLPPPEPDHRQALRVRSNAGSAGMRTACEFPILNVLVV
jgi:hypothetical protein